MSSQEQRTKLSPTVQRHQQRSRAHIQKNRRLQQFEEHRRLTTLTKIQQLEEDAEENFWGLCELLDDFSMDCGVGLSEYQFLEILTASKTHCRRGYM